MVLDMAIHIDTEDSAVTGTTPITLIMRTIQASAPIAVEVTAVAGTNNYLAEFKKSANICL